MYWEHFNLKVNPFGITPDPKFLYLSTPHASAIEWMKLAIEQHEFGMITGEVGSGKTVLSRYLVDSLPEEQFRVAWIINPVMSPTALLREIYSQLFDDKAPHSKSLLVKTLQEGLVNLFLENKYPVVIIDEAQVIPGTKIFEELRLLSNYQTDEQNLISIILMGQQELIKKLKRKTHRAFLQRVRFAITLNPLTAEEVDSYISHRLKVAGLEKESIFTGDAIGKIHSITGGYPRPVNHLAAFSMMEALTHEKGMVDSADVEAAARSILYFEDSLGPEIPEKEAAEAVTE